MLDRGARTNFDQGPCYREVCTYPPEPAAGSAAPMAPRAERACTLCRVSRNPHQVRRENW